MKYKYIYILFSLFSCFFLFKPIYTLASTFYYYSPDDNDEWSNINNWWKDPGFSIQADTLPTLDDDVSINSTVTSNTNDPVSVHSAIFNNGTWDSESSGLTLNVSSGVIFRNLSYNNGTINGNVLFRNLSYNNGTINGNAILDDASYNSGSITGNTVNNTVKSILIGKYPTYTVVLGTKVYVVNQGNDDDSEGSVMVIDSNTDTIVATIPVGKAPLSAAAIDNKVYVANSNSNYVSVIDSNTNTTSNISIVGLPTFVAIVGNKVYVSVTNVSSHFISVIDSKTNTIVASIPIAGAPSSMSIVGNWRNIF